MEEQLQKIRVWARRANMKQLQATIAAKMAPHGYLAELEGDTLTCYRVRKQAGVLGSGDGQA